MAQAKAASAANQAHLTPKEQLEFVQRIGDKEDEQIQYGDKKANTFLTFLAALLTAVVAIELALFVLGGRLTINPWYLAVPLLLVLVPAGIVLRGALWSRLKGYSTLKVGESKAQAAQSISQLIDEQDQLNARLSEKRHNKHRSMQVAIVALFTGGAIQVLILAAALLHWLP